MSLAVVLVEPAGPLNVGSVARLCANFAIDQLRLVKVRVEASGPADRLAETTVTADHDSGAAVEHAHHVSVPAVRQRDDVQSEARQPSHKVEDRTPSDHRRSSDRQCRRCR